jgi:hypothetical protein
MPVPQDLQKELKKVEDEFAAMEKVLHSAKAKAEKHQRAIEDLDKELKAIDSED